jgi:tRNA-dihydrouridine synthase
MVYNGDVFLDGNMDNPNNMLQAVPNLKGVMFGRGLLARPWMLGNLEPREVLWAMHERLYRHATQTLCGDAQVLARLRAFWEYIPLDHKTHKAIMKATTLARYREAVSIAKGMSFCDR